MSRSAATALSAPYLTTEHLRRAREVNERMRRTLDDFDPHLFTQLNQQFHSVLYEPCPNPHILDLVHRGWSRLSGLRDSTFAFVPGRAHHSVDEHAEIVDLIRTGAETLSVTGVFSAPGTAWRQVLEEAGLITRSKRATARLSHLRAQPLEQLTPTHTSMGWPTHTGAVTPHVETATW